MADFGGGDNASKNKVAGRSHKLIAALSIGTVPHWRCIRNVGSMTAIDGASHPEAYGGDAYPAKGGASSFPRDFYQNLELRSFCQSAVWHSEMMLRDSISRRYNSDILNHQDDAFLRGAGSVHYAPRDDYASRGGARLMVRSSRSIKNSPSRQRKNSSSCSCLCQ
jgi:hypothetical protein